MKKNNYFLSLVLVSYVLCVLACSTTPAIKYPQREDDFQINDIYFEPRPEVMEHINSIEQMNNQKFLRIVKDIGSEERYNKVWHYFLTEYFSPQSYDNFGQSALMWACWYGDTPMVYLLLKLTPSLNGNQKITASHINHRSNNGYTALFCSAFRGDDITMLLLLDNGAYLDSQTDKDGENLMHKMAKSGKASNMRTILEHEKYGIKSNHILWQNMFYAENKAGFTPFHYAIVKNDSQMVELFLELEEKLKKPGEEAIVNKCAMRGNQSVYPLCTAFEVGNLDIFQLLLEQVELKTNITFPDGNPNHTDKDLDVISEQTFISESKLMSQLQTYKENDNYFAEMFKNRSRWEKAGRKDKPVIELNEIAEKKAKIIEIIENQEKQYTSAMALKKLNELKLQLNNNIHGIAYNQEHDLLELVAISNWSVQDKIILIDWILDKGRGYKSKYHDKDIFYFCLTNANEKNTDYIKILKYLIENKGLYGDSYDFRQNDAYRILMTKKYIRKNLGKEIISYLEKMKDFCSFDEGNPEVNIKCAVVADESGNGEPDSYSGILFDYFYSKCENGQTVNKIPLCTWCYRKNFLHGVEKILSDEEMAEKLSIKTMKDDEGKKLKDYLDKDKIKNEKFIAMYKTLYPDPVINAANTPPDPSKSKSAGMQGPKKNSATSVKKTKSSKKADNKKKNQPINAVPQ